MSRQKRRPTPWKAEPQRRSRARAGGLPDPQQRLKGRVRRARPEWSHDQKMRPFSDLNSLEKFRDRAVIHVLAYIRVN
jgi:hypothetical protein